MADLWTGDESAALARAATTSAPRLPATYGETFDAAWDQGQFFSQSIAGQNARAQAAQSYLDDIERRTGHRLHGEVDPNYFQVDPQGAVNGAIERAKEKTPDLDINPLADDELDQRAVQLSRDAVQSASEMSKREKDFGGKLGFFLGGVASAATDPINLLALPIAPQTEGVGILSAALRWGVVAAGAQAAIEAAGAPYREQVQPGYGESGAAVAEVLGAFAGGALLGGGTRALGNLWTRVKTGAWPTSVRDAGNLVESDANVANTNRYPGLEGEIAHREALTKTIDDVLEGRPPDVSAQIKPEMEHGLAERLAPVIDARNRAAAALDEAARAAEPGELPFAQTQAAAQAERETAGMAQQLQKLASDAGYHMPPEEAALVAGRLARAPADQVAADLERLTVAPSSAKEAPVRAPMPEPEPRVSETPDAVRDTLASPDHIKAMETDLDRQRMIKDQQIPVELDKNGEAVFGSLDQMMQEVKAQREAADHLMSCINPAEKPQ